MGTNLQHRESSEISVKLLDPYKEIENKQNRRVKQKRERETENISHSNSSLSLSFFSRISCDIYVQS